MVVGKRLTGRIGYNKGDIRQWIGPRNQNILYTNMTLSNNIINRSFKTSKLENIQTIDPAKLGTCF